MLEELKHYEYLGGPDYFRELFLLFEEKEFWKTSDLHAHFYNRQIDAHRVFDGCLDFLSLLGILVQKESGFSWGGVFEGRYGDDRFLAFLFSNETFLSEVRYIFSSENICFNPQSLKGEIGNNAFPLKYANFKRLLVDFSLLLPSDFGKYSISPLFFETLFPLDRRLKLNREMSIEKFALIQDQLARYGEEGELFVIDYEKRRLKRVDILRVSTIDVSAGYDILSFDSANSLNYDRFIEVKSFSGDERFHWSNNEIQKARMYGDRYCLYLVDRRLMHLDSYEPTIIQDAYIEIFKRPENAWLLIPDGYIINKFQRISPSSLLPPPIMPDNLIPE